MGESGGPEAALSSLRAKAILVAVACLAALCVLLGILTITTSFRACRLGGELAQARFALTDLTGRAESLEGRLSRMEGAAPDAEPRAAKPAAARARAGLPERPDLNALTASIRETAEGFRGAPAGPNQERLPGDAGKFMERSLETMADGIDLWRRYRRGEVEDKEFERQRRKLRDSARGAIGFFFAVIWRDRGKAAPPGEHEPGEKGPGEVF